MKHCLRMATLPCDASISTLKAYEHALGQQLYENLFERGVHALAPAADAAAARARLQAIFADAIAAIQEHRTQRLRALPIDRENWNALTEAVSNALSRALFDYFVVDEPAQCRFR